MIVCGSRSSLLLCFSLFLLDDAGFRIILHINMAPVKKRTKFLDSSPFAPCSPSSVASPGLPAVVGVAPVMANLPVAVAPVMVDLPVAVAPVPDVSVRNSCRPDPEVHALASYGAWCCSRDPSGEVVGNEWNPNFREDDDPDSQNDDDGNNFDDDAASSDSNDVAWG